MAKLTSFEEVSFQEDSESLEAAAQTFQSIFYWLSLIYLFRFIYNFEAVIKDKKCSSNPSKVFINSLPKDRGLIIK